MLNVYVSLTRFPVPESPKKCIIVLMLPYMNKTALGFNDTEIVQVKSYSSPEIIMITLMLFLDESNNVIARVCGITNGNRHQQLTRKREREREEDERQK